MSDAAFDEAWLTALERSCDPDVDDVADLANDYRRLCRENAELEAENYRLNPVTTLVGCGRCGRGVRHRNAVKGLCADCADAEIDRLAAELADARTRPSVGVPVASQPRNMREMIVAKWRDESAAARCTCMRARSAACPVHGDGRAAGDA